MCTYIVQNISHKTPSNKYLRLKNTFTISNFTFFPAISLQQNQIATPCELSITILGILGKYYDFFFSQGSIASFLITSDKCIKAAIKGWLHITKLHIARLCNSVQKKTLLIYGTDRAAAISVIKNFSHGLPLQFSLHILQIYCIVLHQNVVPVN